MDFRRIPEEVTRRKGMQMDDDRVKIWFRARDTVGKDVIKRMTFFA